MKTAILREQFESMVEIAVTIKCARCKEPLEVVVVDADLHEVEVNPCQCEWE